MASASTRGRKRGSSPLKPQGPLLFPQLWKVKKALKMSVVWRGLRPECQVSLCRALWAAPPHPPPIGPHVLHVPSQAPTCAAPWLHPTRCGSPRSRWRSSDDVTTVRQGAAPSTEPALAP